MSRANPLEVNIENALCAKAKKYWGLKNRKMNGWGYNSWPDRQFFIPGGKPLLMEVKRKGLKPTEAQAALHKELTALGYEVVVVDSVADGWVALERSMRRAGHL